MAGRYGGYQDDMYRLEPDPLTGEMVPVRNEVEVSDSTEHEHSPLGEMFAADKTNIGIYAALAALAGSGAQSALGGGSHGISGSALGEVSGHMSPGLAGGSTGTANAMGGATFLGGGGGSAGVVPSLGSASFAGGAGGAGVAAPVAGAAATPVGLREFAGSSAPSDSLSGASRLGSNAASTGMGFGKLAGLSALGMGFDVLGGLLEGDEDEDKNDPMKSFEGTGYWSDPINERQRMNEMNTRFFNALAKRTPVGQRSLPKNSVSGLGDFGSTAGSALAPLDFGIEGGSGMTDWLDNMIRQNGGR